jgi:hypothetical protein
MEVRFDDKLQIPPSRKIQATGQMLADCAIARTGILSYAARELGSMFSDKDPNSLVRVAQLSDDLFAEETLEKFRCAPVTIGHPLADVDTVNMKELGVGTLEGKPFQDGDRLAASLVLNDAAAIDLVNQGTQELSVRAYYELTRVDDSADYDAVRTIKTVNHVAIVDRGRAGSTCRISDSEDGLVEEVQIAVLEVVEAPVEAVEEVVEQVVPTTPEEHKEAVVETIEAVVDPSKGELDAALEEIAALKEAAVKLEAELDAAKEKVLSDEAIEALVQERLEFRSVVAKLSDMDISGMSVIDAKRAVVAEQTGMQMDDRDEVYVQTRFDILLEDSEGITPMAKVLGQVALSDSKVEKKVYVNPAEEARQRMIARNKGDK